MASFVLCCGIFGEDTLFGVAIPHDARTAIATLQDVVFDAMPPSDYPTKPSMLNLFVAWKGGAWVKSSTRIKADGEDFAGESVDPALTLMNPNKNLSVYLGDQGENYYSSKSSLKGSSQTHSKHRLRRAVSRNRRRALNSKSLEGFPRDSIDVCAVLKVLENIVVLAEGEYKDDEPSVVVATRIDPPDMSVKAVERRHLLHRCYVTCAATAEHFSGDLATRITGVELVAQMKCSCELKLE